MKKISYSKLYFQKICINTNAVASSKLINVLVVIPSFINHQVHITITTIPDPNPSNLPGHSFPSNPCTTSEVAHINMYEIGIPDIANIHG